MDKWLEYYYGTDSLPETAILCAGTVSQETKDRILNKVEITNYRKDVQDYYLIDTDNGLKILIFDIIGAPVLIDIAHNLEKGGTKEAYFLSFAGTKKDFNIGGYFIPERIRCHDGLTEYWEAGIKHIDIQEKAYENVKRLMHGIKYYTGMSASVPSFFHNHPKVDAAIEDEGILAVDMEASSAVYFLNKKGIQCSPLLIISDNPKTDITDAFEIRERALYIALERIIR